MRDEELYLIAYNDFANREVDKKIWIKAMAKAQGEKKLAKWHYVELRVEQMLHDPNLKESLKPVLNPSSSSTGAYMIWFSFLLFFVIMVAGISFDFSILGFDFIKLLDFLDLPSLVIVVFPAIFFGIASTSWKSYWHCWSYPFSTRKEVTADNAQSAARCLKVMGDSGFLMGIVGTFIGAVLILRNSEAIEDIGTAVSVALITLFYGTICKLLCYIADQRIRNLYLNS